MTEKQAKKVFLKQAKPFFRRYDAERKRKRKNARLRQSAKFVAGISGQGAHGSAQFFIASFEDKFRGRQEMHIPILFSLPEYYFKGKAFQKESEFDAFRKYCEEV